MTKRISPEVEAQVAQLFVDHAEAVFVSALRAVGGDRREAETFVQEAFQAAAVQWDEIANDDPAAQRAWLRRVAINKAIDRHRVGRRVHLVAEVEIARTEPSAEQIALPRIVKDRCLQVIKEMPPRRRLVAYLRWHEEWDVREIAQYLGIAVSTVRVHLRDSLTCPASCQKIWLVWSEAVSEAAAPGVA
jgi:RNA polymerase sigma factor (sigma-70 family)